jgi:hypothetical protein
MTWLKWVKCWNNFGYSLFLLFYNNQVLQLEWLANLHGIQEMPGSNLNLDTDYYDWIFLFFLCPSRVMLALYPKVGLDHLNSIYNTSFTNLLPFTLCLQCWRKVSDHQIIKQFFFATLVVCYGLKQN